MSWILLSRILSVASYYSLYTFFTASTALSLKQTDFFQIIQRIVSLCAPMRKTGFQSNKQALQQGFTSRSRWLLQILGL